MQMREKRATRLTVHRSAKHMYAQVVSPDGDRILAQASTLDPSIRGITLEMWKRLVKWGI